MSRKKKLIVVSIVAILLLLLIIFVYSRRDKAATSETNNRPATAQGTNADQEEASASAEEAAVGTNPPPANPNQPANPPAPPAPTISLTGKQQSGQVVQVSAIVKNLTAGTCQATFTGPQGTQPIARTSPIINKGNFYGCTDMNIPVADFPKSGTWHMAIFAANQNNKSNVAEADIQVTK